jgi:hypothetical protein
MWSDGFDASTGKCFSKFKIDTALDAENYWMMGVPTY